MFNTIVKDSQKTIDQYWLIAKNLPWILARHAFLFIVLFVVLEGLLASFLYYTYAFMPQNRIIEVGSAPESFKEKTYQSVLESWEKRRQIIENSAQREYNNPFQ